MSTTELRFRHMCDNFYRTNNLESLNDSERMQLLVVFTNMLSNSHTEESTQSNSASSSPIMFSVEEKQARAEQSRKDFLDGKCRPIEEFFEGVESKYPWLCEQ